MGDRVLHRSAAAAVTLLLVTSGCAMRGAATQPAAGTSGSPTPSAIAAAATPTPTPSPVPTEVPAQMQMVLQAGQVTARVRELQGRLRQLKLFTPYNLTDAYGPATTRAVAAFQGGQGMSATGNVDRATWTALTGATKEPSTAEMSNTDPGPAVLSAATEPGVLKALQLRLKQAGMLAFDGAPSGALDDKTVAGVKAFQSKRSLQANGVIDQRTWDYLRGDTREPTPWEIAGTPPPTAEMKLSPECVAESAKGGAICSSMDERKVAWVVDGKPTLVMDARFGSADHPTNKGTFVVYFKKKDLVSTMFGTDIPMPYAICFDDSRCVHFSDGFARYGWNGNSHGCINVKDMDGVKWLYDQAVVGRTKVFIY